MNDTAWNYFNRSWICDYRETSYRKSLTSHWKAPDLMSGLLYFLTLFTTAIMKRIAITLFILH